MGQVPKSKKPKAAIYDLVVGRGRIATHLSHYLGLSAHPYLIKTWHRGLPESELPELIASARTVFLCIKDDALSDFLNKQHEQSKFVHFSGSQSFKKSLGAHPLMTFSTDLYTKNVYEQIPFIVDKGVENFSNFFPTLKNRTYQINEERKSFYHAMCVLSGNFTTVMWSALAKEMNTQLQLPHDILNLYLQKVAENTLKHQMDALTGPLARGDQKVIETHLRILQGTPWFSLYQDLIKTYERFRHE